MIRNVPLIVVLGSTGTGKTKLSIELARKFGAEIISADSMQVYKGLDIVTAKATKGEQLMAKHHLLDMIDAGKMFTVVDFRDAALPIIDNLMDNKKIPILVGGTNYYIESILWKVLVNSPLKSSKRKMRNDTEIDAKKANMKTDDSSVCGETSSHQNDQFAELHKLLESIDPDTAKRLHPNEIRKIRRAIDVFKDTGKTLSAIISEQRNIPGGNYLGRPLRYDHIIMFWLQCDQEILNKRLDARIDVMLSQGLLKEIRNFYNSYMAITKTKDCPKGALQAIGVKEFIPYLEKYDECEDDRINTYLANDKASNPSRPDGLNLLEKCLAELRLVSKRYSRNQPKWIRNRFLSSESRQVPPIYDLWSTKPEHWTDDVYKRAENVVRSYMDNRASDLKPLEKLLNPRKDMDLHLPNVCNVCNRHFVGEFQWRLHLWSKKHEKQLERLKKKNVVDECTVDKVKEI